MDRRDRRRQCTLEDIKCPYCNGAPFSIGFDSAQAKEVDETLPVDEALPEFVALPYARDIGPFDPELGTDEARGKDADELRGTWSQVGHDFYPSISWERIGILRWEKDQEIYYCVARCPHCQDLLDVFANFTESKVENLTVRKPLSEIWPHLLGRTEDTNRIKPYLPKSKLSQLFGNNLFVLAFLMLVYLGSIVPSTIPYFQQSALRFGPFLAENFSTLLLRGIVIVALFSLLLFRKHYIKLFRNESAFSELFNIRGDTGGLTYWANFAVCRFVGYQKDSGWFSPTQVMVVGGLLSSVVLLVTWAANLILDNLGILDANISQNSYVMLAELTFWLIASYIFGVIGWAVSAIPIYIFKGLQKLPMKVAERPPWFAHLRVIEDVGVYSGLGICILIVTIISLAALPVLLISGPGFQESLWVIVWAQFMLIFFFSVITNFSLNSNQFSKWAIINAVLPITVYILLRIGLETLLADSIKPFAELLIFVLLCSYLFYLQNRVMRGEIKEIKIKLKKKQGQDLDNKLQDLNSKHRVKQIKIPEISQQLVTAAGSRRIELRLELRDVKDEIESLDDDIKELRGEIEEINNEPDDGIYYQRTMRWVKFVLGAVLLNVVGGLFGALLARYIGLAVTLI